MVERAEVAVDPLLVPATPDTAPPFRAVGFLLSTLGFASARGFREVLIPIGLEPRQWALLRAVAFSPGQSQQALGESLQIPPSRMVAVIDVLEERGLVERRHNPDDRRTRALYLTSAGRRLLKRAFGLASDYEARLCAGLTPDQREQLIEMLTSIATQLRITPGCPGAIPDEHTGC